MKSGDGIRQRHTEVANKVDDWIGVYNNYVCFSFLPYKSFQNYFVQMHNKNTMFTIYLFLSFKKRIFKMIQGFLILSDFSQNFFFRWAKSKNLEHFNHLPCLSSQCLPANNDKDWQWTLTSECRVNFGHKFFQTLTNTKTLA